MFYCLNIIFYYYIDLICKFPDYPSFCSNIRDAAIFGFSAILIPFVRKIFTDFRLDVYVKVSLTKVVYLLILLGVRG